VSKLFPVEGEQQEAVKMAHQGNHASSWSNPEGPAGFDGSHGKQVVRMLLVAAWLCPALALAQWSPPGFYSVPAWIGLRPVLISPTDGFEISDNNGNNVTQAFRWRSRSLPRGPYEYPYLSRALPYPGYAGPMRRIDPSYFASKYAVCIYDSVRCDLGRSGVQILAPAGSQTRTFVTLPSSSLQGRSFNWAVRECPPAPVRMTPYARGQCVWSESNQISWAAQPEPEPVPPTEGLGTPCDLSIRTRPAAAGFNVRLRWCDVENASEYIVCLAENPNHLANCEKDSDPQDAQDQVFKPAVAPTDNKWERNVEFVSDIPEHTGGSQSPFHWKVAACKNNPRACGEWSAVADGQWPQVPIH